MDSSINIVPGIMLKTGSGAGELYSAFCGHISYISADGHEFAPAPEIDYGKVAAVTAGLDESACTVNNIPALDGTFAGLLYDKTPFNKVEVLIYELEVNDSFVCTAARCIWRGLLYRLQSLLCGRVINVECRETKFYFDKTAGVVCTEQCSAAYFGDKICGKTVSSVTGVVESIAGTVMVLTATPSGAAYLYNNGYVEYNGIQIKITYWVSGDTFNLAMVPPTSWVGKTITIKSGCDKTIASCRRFSNESRFFGLGYSMVDYNAITEEA